VEKNQYRLCEEVLHRLNAAKILDDLILIGSWCMPFYREYFSKIDYKPAIRTKDIDFLVPFPQKIKVKADIPDLLKDLGFVVGFKGAQGYIKLEHPDLLIEFLVPEKSKGTDGPFPLPKLGVNAVALRFLNLLTDNTIKVYVQNFYITLPHPANFALHKLIIFQRRVNEEKIAKDRESAVKILKSLIENGEISVIKNVFDSVPQKWQKKIIKGLEEAKEKNILEKLVK